MRRLSKQVIVAASLLSSLVGVANAEGLRLPAEMQEYAPFLNAGETIPMTVDGAESPELGTVVADGYLPQSDAKIRDRHDRFPWSRYAVLDVLYLQTNNATKNAPLALQNESTSDSGAVALSTDALESSMAPGLRLFYGSHGDDDLGWEVGWLGLWSMHADAAAFGDETLRLPGDLGTIADSGFDRASAVEPRRNAGLNMIEVNFFDSCRFGGCDPCAKRAMHRSTDFATARDWMLGIRWAGLEDTAALDVTAEVGDEPTSYRVTASSNLIGPQVGYRRHTQWRGWGVETWAKAAVVASILSQSQGPVVGPFDGVLIRGPRSVDDEGMGMIGDLNFTIIRRINDTWGVRLGYNLIWVTGVALAADQWDFTDTPESGTGLNSTGSLFLQGVNLGLEGRW
ncbi:MAG: BBP7 family outer membrane beta-barrel protein [Planctomycetaceae bacterium]